MTTRQMSESRLASLGARSIFDSYCALHERFHSLTRRAKIRFEARDWPGMAADAAERLDLYGERALDTASQVAELLGDRLMDKSVWAAMKAAYSAFAMDRQDFEVAETWFNSITRRTFATVGVDPRIEFVDTDFDTPPTEAKGEVYRSYSGDSATELIEQALAAAGLRAPFPDLAHEARSVSAQISDKLRSFGIEDGFDRLDLVSDLFYRGKGAYLVGRVVAGDEVIPLAIALENEEDGLHIDAVLLSENDVSILFSFAHSYFHVEGERPYDLVRFIREQLPRKRASEVYISLGRPRHGKTEMFRELLQHLETSGERFVKAPGKEGLVMSVFTLPSFELVFKVIKDNFPPQKTLTPSQVMDKYRLVYRHDRAGRLVDSQSFEHLEFKEERFDPGLLDELLEDCSRNVIREQGTVEVALAYAQRRVTPLDIYLDDAPIEDARRAVVDYGNAIKDLAVTGIFPGDLLLKNFGLTRHSRVVFYDYDELTEITDCNFRNMPVAGSLDEEMSETPWFGVGQDDIFPAEFPSFLGLTGELRDAFVANHSDLFEASWWKAVQDRIGAGEIVSIYPYSRNLRLSAHV